MNPLKVLQKLLLMLGLVGTLFVSVSCSSSSARASAEITIDPRFIGTWVGQAQYRGKERDMVLVLEPTGKGMAHARGNGSFDKIAIKWSTRSNILEIRENGGLFKMSFNFSYGNTPYGGYRSYGQQRYGGYSTPPPQPSPLGGVRRYNVISLEENRFIAKDVANPRIVDQFRRYSKRPTSDPYPAFSWMDNGN
jgi:hypothetical protein